MARIDIKSTGTTLDTGILQLENGVAMDATLRKVADQNNTVSPLLLSTNLVQTRSTLKITTADNPYIDAEDNSGNNRFTIGRDPSSQQVNLDFASNPTGSTTNVGAIRTYKDGVNLSEAMNFREDGNIGVGDLAVVSPSCQLDVIRYTTGSVNNNYQFRILNSADGLYPYTVLLLEHNNRTGVGNQGGASISIKDGFANVTRASIGFDYFNSGSYSANGGTLRISNDGQGNLNLATNGVDALRVFKDQGVQIGGVSTNLSSVARLHVIGSGSTSATTSLLVQNSAGTQKFAILDNGQIMIPVDNTGSALNSPICFSNSGGNSCTIAGSDSSDSMWFRTNSIERLRITASGIGVNTNANNNSSAQFQIDATTRGFLPPRMTTTQKNAIATPATGLVVMDITTLQLCVYNGSSWVDLH